MDENARPLDVAQERVAEAGSAARSLDQPRHVRDRRPALVVRTEIHDAQVRFERRERVVGDLRGGRRQRRRGASTCRRSAARRARCRRSGGARAGASAPPRLALLGVLRGLVGGRLEVGVAESAATAARDHRLLADGDEVGEQLAGLVVEDRGARRNVDRTRSSPAAPWRRAPLAATAGCRLEVMLEAEVAQRRLAGIDRAGRPSRPTAIPAVGSAARNVRLAPERRCPVTARAGLDEDLDAVENISGALSHGRPTGGRPARPANAMPRRVAAERRA